MGIENIKSFVYFKTNSVLNDIKQIDLNQSETQLHFSISKAFEDKNAISETYTLYLFKILNNF